MLRPGDRVVVRERPWTIVSSRGIGSKQSVLQLEAQDGEEPRAATVVVPPDECETLPPLSLRLAPEAFDSYQAWLDAHRLIRLACARDEGIPIGACWGRVQLAGFQFVPLQRLLAQPRPSLLIADDVGLGKTIEAGMMMIELIARRRARRILVVTPAGLVRQWRDELREKFNLDVCVLADAGDLADAQTELPAGLSPWEAFPRVVTSIDYLKKLTVQRRALASRWDLVVVDEAHALARSGTARNPVATHRTRLGEALRGAARGLILLTATPHNGHLHSFQSLLALVEPAHATLEGTPDDRRRRISRAMVRRMKAQIVRHDDQGRPVPHFPRRHVCGIPVTPADDDYRQVLAKVSAYCSKTARDAGSSDDAELIGFAMQIVKKRALSSRAALESTLANRLEALRKESERDEPVERNELRDLSSGLPLAEREAERIALRIVRSAIPAESKRRNAEIRKLKGIRKLLDKAPAGDPKIAALLAELGRVFAADRRDKVIVFTEYLDTLESLKQALDGCPDLTGRWVVLQGGLSPRQRAVRQAEFERGDVRVLLATDAASEGLNLQRACHRVIHFELPWNPNRLEQRNGRVDRYGQTREPQIRYLFHQDSPEEAVLHRLVEKIEAMVESRVSTPDILGVLAGLEDLQSGLTDLDPEADDLAERSARLVRVFDEGVSTYERDVRPLLSADGGEDDRSTSGAAFSADPLLPDDDRLESIARRWLGIGAFAPTAHEGTVRISVPPRWRGAGVRESYPRATFSRSVAVTDPEIEFITPLHPLGRLLTLEAERRLVQAVGDDGSLRSRRFACGRVAASAVPAVVFTFLGWVIGGDGAVEERILAVRVGWRGEPLGPVELDDLADELTFDAALPPAALVVEALSPHFDDLASRALAESQRELAQRAAELRARRQAASAVLRTELARDLADREIEIEQDYRQRRGEQDDAGQTLLFSADAAATRRGPEAALEAARQVAADRERDLQAFERIDEPAPPRPLGALVLVPDGWPR